MRVKRTPQEDKRIGFPSAAQRLEVLEAIVVELATKVDIDKSALDILIAKMDRLDIDFPNLEL